MNNKLFLIMLLSAVFAIQSVMAQDSGVVVLSDTVTGNQEQPKVIYIVPWKSADDTTILYQPLSTRLQNDVFKHIERPEHIRELDYLNQLSQAAVEEPEL